MALPVLVLRPEPGASATLALARDKGLDASAFPLFEVRPLAWEPVARTEVDALLLGSANALRHGGSQLEAYCGLPAYCVGETTARAAAQAGLHVAAAGRGGLQALLDARRAEHHRLLRLAGRERTVLNAPEGVAIVTREVYASEPLPPPGPLLRALGRPALALLHSGEAAARLLQICAGHRIDRSRIHLVAIGPRVAARAGDGWASVRSAAHPEDSALLALTVQMCQEARPGQ
ncbi:uroporphyrinogen-III synthase [Novosphingobium panipatense]|uniref:Uroporphyrinogen-III synthase n=1 Tax=Novosphingobium panipatense TaxID=428991 RepID=A0ABY1Q7U3_9SPHN|nr:uroporphyrinogen-III synthase [Novosphingobium panipatense]SMP61385.1 uroporphyrinogen-III synthase [Novosphingobium panipatense]